MVMIASTGLVEPAPTVAVPQLLAVELAVGVGQFNAAVMAPAAVARTFPDELSTVTL
jgi:hypothetical protein